MNQNDIKSLEQRYGLKLPDEYVTLVLDPKNQQKYENRESLISIGLLFDRKKLEKENDQCRNTPVFCDFWNPKWFAIHADGMGNVYFITTDPYDGKVYDYDHEQTLPGYNPAERAMFESLESFLLYLDQTSESGNRRNSSLLKRFKRWIFGVF